MRLILSTLACCLLILTGCATANRIEKVSLGMTRKELIAKMGNPSSISIDGSSEYYNYALSTTEDQALNRVTVPCYIRLIDGKVVSYGTWEKPSGTQPRGPQSRPST